MVENRESLMDGLDLVIPSKVRCEADHGDPSYMGEAIGVSDAVHTSHQGIPYRWVEVRGDDGRRSVWPSNRLEPA